ncbi:hypothetical protein [Alkalihalobacillus pseudalcaliphilus]|uniref:hypothetical protein n=1 Tax=Alkalihalobacillus pseudalcaliphilus TaxID=79884 RepID=UPI00064DB3F8|nr:hypothetical protein [Alkalihalobacillus pseudalcaliphilus]KMK76264.1 hypothetical protein AB990_13730 [Alkalihalobacillus pseudalcaliphilus]
MIYVNNKKLTFNIKWISEYESIWSIFEKIKLANLIEFGELKKIFNNNIRFIERQNTLMMTEGLPELISSHQKVISENLFGKLNIINKSDLFSKDFKFCNTCILLYHHSVLHQLVFVNTCPFHPVEKLQIIEVDAIYNLYNNPFTIFFNKVNRSGNEKFFCCSKLRINDTKLLKYLEMDKVRQGIIYIFQLTGQRTSDSKSLNKLLNLSDNNKTQGTLFRINREESPIKLMNKFTVYQTELINSTLKIQKSYTRNLRKNFIKGHKSCIHKITRKHPQEAICSISSKYLFWRMTNENLTEQSIVHNSDKKKPFYSFGQIVYCYRYNNEIYKMLSCIMNINKVNLGFYTISWLVNKVYALFLISSWTEELPSKSKDIFNGDVYFINIDLSNYELRIL